MLSDRAQTRMIEPTPAYEEKPPPGNAVERMIGVHPRKINSRSAPGRYGGYLLTCSDTFVCACGPPVLFAVTVMFDFPILVVGVTVTFRVELPVLPGATFTLDGVKVAVAPLGRPVAVSVTGPRKPFEIVTLMVFVTDGEVAERLTLMEAGLAFTESAPPRLTVSVNVVAECVSVPLVPFTVNG